LFRARVVIEVRVATIARKQRGAIPRKQGGAIPRKQRGATRMGHHRVEVPGVVVL
jgi:hypothetical protein